MFAMNSEITLNKFTVWILGSWGYVIQKLKFVCYTVMYDSKN